MQGGATILAHDAPSGHEYDLSKNLKGIKVTQLSAHALGYTDGQTDGLTPG